jgi:hypothetical protein
MRQLITALIITLLSGCVSHIPLDNISNNYRKNENISVAVQPNKIDNSAFSDLRQNDNLFDPPLNDIIKTTLESNLKTQKKATVNITEHGVYFQREAADFIPFISLATVFTDHKYLCKIDYTVMTDSQIMNDSYKSEKIGSSVDSDTQIANYQTLIKECLDGLTHKIQTQLDKNK